MSLFTSTIAAVSTPPGKGGVAVLRVSGEDAFAIAEKVFVPRCGKAIADIPPRTQIYGDIIAEGERIDDGLLTRFPAPHSYTGENTVEISCHGGILLTRTVLEALLTAGAVPAGRGEFTRRAFLNGRLSLTDAEAIGSLIEAKTHAQILLSESGARSRLSAAIEGIRSSLVTLLSSIYARIDYPDEDLGDFTEEETAMRIRDLLSAVGKLKRTYKTGRAVNEGIRTAIVGKPNVGKSSLYNALLREDAAIVTDIAGTTRDVLTRDVALGRVLLHLADTAGIRETDDRVEKIGVDRSLCEMRDAGLILAVFDGSAPLTGEDLHLAEEVAALGATAVAVLNKADLGQNAETAKTLQDTFRYTVSLSAKEGAADALTPLTEELFTDGDIQIGEDAVLSSARQYASLLRADEALRGALNACLSGVATDAVSSDLELALGAISELDGRAVSEAVVSDIFDRFCVGK